MSVVVSTYGHIIEEVLTTILIFTILKGRGKNTSSHHMKKREEIMNEFSDHVFTPTEKALEPDLGLNKIHKGEVDVVECALTSSSCKVTVSEHSRNLGETTTHQKTSKTGRQVPGKPLLDLIHETKVSRIDALKIDIEGEEIPALSSFFNHASISLWPRLIICEIFGPDGHLLQKLLEANGYKRTGISKMNAIFRLSQI